MGQGMTGQRPTDQRPIDHRVVLALGSNIGDSLGHLRAAVVALKDAGVRLTALSPVYETAPIGGPDQANYLNAVVLGSTDMSPRDLLAVCQRIEADRDRIRDVRWGPRTLDIDVISIDDLQSDDPQLTLPHPRATQRAFVCVPWLDVDPHAMVPGIGALADVVVVLGHQDVVRRDETLNGSTLGSAAQDSSTLGSAAQDSSTLGSAAQDSSTLDRR